MKDSTYVAEILTNIPLLFMTALGGTNRSPDRLQTFSIAAAIFGVIDLQVERSERDLVVAAAAARVATAARLRNSANFMSTSIQFVLCDHTICTIQ